MPAKPRRQRNPAKEKFWRRIIRRQHNSGLPVRGFCEREGLKDFNFLGWRRGLNRRDREQATPLSRSATQEFTEPSESTVFLPVRVVEADSVPSRTAPLIEIVLDGGATVRVPCGFDPRTL